MGARSRRVVLAFAVMTFAGGFTTFAASPGQAVVTAGPTAYVMGGIDAITPINTATRTAGTAFSTGAAAGSMSITPDGNSAFLTDSYSARVWRVNLASQTTSARIPVTGDQRAIAMTPNGKTVFTAAYNSITVYAIDTATNTVHARIWLPNYCDSQGIAVNPSGTIAYVACGGLGTVFPINTATDVLGTPVRVGGSPDSLAITPNGKTLFVTDDGRYEVLAIDTASRKITAYIQTGELPQGIAIAPNGGTAYVANEFSDSVTPINTATLKTGLPISVDHDPYEIAITPDGTTAYVTYTQEDEVTPITLATGTVGPPIPVAYALTIAIAPDQAPAARFSATPAAHGLPTSFNASASSVKFGRIAKYDWQFGDGTSLVGTTPTATHTYATAGSYTASVTETDSAGTSTTVVFTGQTVSRNGGISAHVAKTLTIP